MKFFPAKKKENEDTSSTEPEKDAEITSPDTESPQKSRFGFKPKFSDKSKQDLSDSTETSKVKADTVKQQVIVDESKQGFSTSSVLETSQIEPQTKAVAGDGSDVAKIMEVISSSKNHTINPSVNLEENQLLYPQLASIGNYEYVQNLLDKLASPTANMLEKGVYERLPVCPEHSKQFSTGIKLYCSSCFATDIVKLHLIEHKVCGHISEIKDMTDADLTKCISCKQSIKDAAKEIRRLGRWYQCNKCNTKFDNCVVKLHCRQFDHDFEINQANMIPIPFYKAKSDVKTPQVFALSIVPEISKKIEGHGFAVQDSSSIKGKSGVTHRSDIYATNNMNQSILIDIKTSEKEVLDTEVHSMIVKTLDVSPLLAILVAIPSVSDAARTMATSTNITVVTGKNISEIIASIEQVINSRLSGSEISK